MVMRMFIACFLSFLCSAFASDTNLLNYADPAFHPYADPTGGRDLHRYTDAQVNELRLYDFYSRQADYYLEIGKVPEIIPAFPGLDAGISGHWGTHPQIHYHNHAWSRMDNGSTVGAVITQGKIVSSKRSTCASATKPPSRRLLTP